MDLILKNRTAIVTGGGKGFGKAICTVLVQEGANVIMNYRSNRQDALSYIKKLNDNYSGHIIGFCGDMTISENRERIFETALKEYGSIDILINNAASWTTALVADMPKEEFEHVLDVNPTVPFLMSQKLIQYLIKSGKRGSIMNVVSKAAITGSERNHAHYAASKAGLVGFTKSLAKETASAGITVNAIAPGYMKTEMLNKSFKNRDDEDQQVKKIPVGRIADPIELANVVAFMVSEKASYFTGTVFNGTGGMIMF